MTQQENTASFNEVSNDKENISILQNKSNSPKKTKSNINLLDTKKIKPISLSSENILFSGQNKKKLISNNIKYGIDENGNPMNIKEYYKSINDSVNVNSNTSIYSGISNINQKLKKPI